MMTGRLWHYVSEAVSDPDRSHSFPRHGTSFSDGFLEAAWSKVSRNVRAALALVPPQMQAGVHINRPWGHWRDSSGEWQISLDAWNHCVSFAAGSLVPWPADLPSTQCLELRSRVQAIADTRAFGACVNRIRVPVMIYVGYEPPEWLESPEAGTRANELAAMLTPVLAARAGRPVGAQLILCIDSITGRPQSQWILSQVLQWGIRPAVEGVPEIGSVYDTPDQLVFCTWRDYMYQGGADGARDRNSKTTVLYETDQGATPDLAVEGLAAGVDMVVDYTNSDVAGMCRAIAAAG